MRLKNIIFGTVLTCAIFSFGSAMAAGDFTVLNRTEYVKGGETVQISGSALDTVSGITISRIDDVAPDKGSLSFVRQPRPTVYYEQGTEAGSVIPKEASGAVAAEILSKTNSDIVAKVPDFEFGIYSVKLKSDSREEMFYINSPVVEWNLGDMGPGKATPNTNLRIQGKNLYYDGLTPTVLIENAEGIKTEVELVKCYDKYSLEVKLPEGLANGTYKVWVHSGLGDNTCWSEPGTLEIVDGLNWPTTVFNVKDYGAVGDMKHDDSVAFKLAVAAAGENGGGVVYIPRGTYILSKGFDIPEKVEIRGESNKKSQIVFDTSEYDDNEVPDTLIGATDNFAIRDLYIWGTRVKTLLSNFSRNEEFLDEENIFLENLVIRCHEWMGKVDINNHKYDAMREYTPEGNNFSSAYLIKLSGMNLKIVNCDINSGSDVLSISGGDGLLFSGCTIRSSVGGTGVPIQGFSNCIVENNVIKDGQISYGAWNIRLTLRNIYHARNIQEYNFKNDRETLTTDGQKHVFNGTGAVVTGNKVVFPNDLKYSESKGVQAFVGAQLLVVTGDGEGQVRYVTAYDEATRTATLSGPFRVNPKTTDSLQWASTYSNFVITDNSFKESNCVSTYAMGYNWTVDGNYFDRTAGVQFKAYSVYSAYGSVHYLDMVDNTFDFLTNYIHWTGIMEADYLSGRFGLYLNANNKITHATLRDNIFINGARIRLNTNYAQSNMTGIMISGNKFEETFDGIEISASYKNTYKGVVIVGNEYNNVGTKRIYAGAVTAGDVIDLDI